VILTQITGGSATTCALATTGAAYCWGAGASGQLGNGTTTATQSTPVAVTTTGTPLSGLTLTQISSGSATTCALASIGTAYCWGAGASGQLGNGTTTAAQSTPVAVTTTGALSGVTLTQITGGSATTCALASIGTAYCWGAGASGQLGNNTEPTTQSTAVAVTTTGVSGLTLTQISAGNSFECALAGTDAAYCWGLNSSGQLGNPATAAAAAVFDVPTAVTSGATMVTAGTTHSCLLRNGKAFCWGDNAFGELGINSASPTQSLVPLAVYTGGVLSGKTLVQISAGTDWTCALDTAGAAYCWGDNSSGSGDLTALGNGTNTASTAPVLVSGSHVFTDISVGTDSACALTNAGVAWCWGNNHFGQVGNSGTGLATTPVAVTTTGVLSGLTLTQIDVGGNVALGGFACAQASTGAAYCWGLGTNGQLGNNSTTSSTSPVAVTATGALSGISLAQVATGGNSSCALGAAGGVYCWGVGSNGQLGNSASVQSTVPVTVTASGALAGVSPAQISAGTSFACALGSAGAAYCWGAGASGQLGNGTSTATQNTPVAVSQGAMPSGTTLFQISSGGSHTCVQDTTGAFYCWGDNANGDLGNNSTTASNVPVVVQGIVPGAPTGVTATPGDTTATISWTAPASFGTGTLTGYTATATAASGTFTCSTSGATTCVITGLTDGTTYLVTVVTRTTDGNSLPSSPAVSVMPVGSLTMTSPSSLTWSVTGSGSNQSKVDAVAGDQQLTATDNTGTGAGWHVTLSATTFTTGPKSLPNTGAINFNGSLISPLASTAPSATCVASCTLPTDTTTYPVAITTAISAPTTYTIYDTAAATGLGVMTIGGSAAANPIGWWVNLPASVFTGTYTSTVTLSILSGP
jgi:alpha-tubulin suppressor-like RCC1 family protein